MKEGRRPRRWVLIGIGGPLALLVLVGVLLVLGPHWLNAPGVRDALCAQISEATGLDASLGSVEFRLSQGLEILGRDLTLRRKDQHEPLVQVPQIRVRPAWREALRGEVSIRSLTLDGLELSLDGITPGATLEQGKAQWLRSLVFSVQHIRIVHAHLFLEKRALHLRGLDGDLWPSREKGALHFKGKGEIYHRDVCLGDVRGRGYLDRQGGARVLLDGEGLEVSGLQGVLLPSTPSLQLGGNGELSLQLEGSDRESHFRGTWKAKDLEVAWPSKLDKPFMASEARGSFQGTWSAAAWSLTQFKVDAGFVHLEGGAQKDREGIHGRISGGPFRFEDVVPHLGQGLIGRKLLGFFRTDLGPGTARGTTFTFRWGKDQDDQGEGKLKELRMAMEFKEASLVFDRDLPPLDQLSGILLWEGERVLFENLRGTYKGHPFRSMEARITEIGRVSLLEGRFALDLAPDDLLELWKQVTTNGSPPLVDHSLEGRCALDIELKKPFLLKKPLVYRASVGLQDVAGKLPHAPVSWKVSAGKVVASPDRLDILHAEGTLEEISLSVKGSIENWSKSAAQAVLDGTGAIPASAVRRLASRFVRGFETDARGPSAIGFSIRGNINEPHVSLSWDLTPLGMRYGGHWQKPAQEALSLYADVHRTPDGRWRLVQGRARGERAEVRGEGGWSPGQAGGFWLKFSGRDCPAEELVEHIPSLARWIRGGRLDLMGEVNLQENAPWRLTVHPRDVLIDRGILGHELRIRSGDLLWTEGEIRADPLEVEVLGGLYTLWGKLQPLGPGFSFTGRLRGKEVQLESWISSEDGKEETHQREAPSPSAFQQWIQTLPSSQLTFEFDTLRLRDLGFRGVKGRVFSEGKRLVLEDASGSVAGGQMTAEGQLGSDGAFWVAGGVDGADIGRVFSSLGFGEDVIEGPLFMEFGVQGWLMGKRAGRHLGNIEIVVDKGVIRKFPILSNILSLMNVSQILMGRLPDLSSEGMVFHKIQGSFFLKNGIASTEDFRIHSESMGVTMVGDVNVIKGQCDLDVAVEPFVGLNRVVGAIPVIRHYLAGPDGSLIGMDFMVSGPISDPHVKAMPLYSLGGGILRFFKRLVENPFHDLWIPPDDLASPPQEEFPPH